MMTEPRPKDDADRSPSGRPAGRSASRSASRSAKTKFTEVVVVCSKCAKRQGLHPRAVRALLKKAGKKAAKVHPAKDAAGGRRKLCIVESGCLGPCPKHAIAVATGASLAAGRVVLLDPEAGPAEALAAVLDPMPPRRPPNSAPIQL